MRVLEPGIIVFKPVATGLIFLLYSQPLAGKGSQA